jgi:hypothetical protein
MAGPTYSDLYGDGLVCLNADVTVTSACQRLRSCSVNRFLSTCLCGGTPADLDHNQTPRLQSASPNGGLS